MIDAWLDVWRQRDEARDHSQRATRVANFNTSSGLPFFKIENSCNDAVIYSPIEPLMGALRHPKYHCFPGQDYKFNKDYLMPIFDTEIVPAAAQQSNFFFDLGCSTYNAGFGGASQSWFINQYRQRGIEFDRILAWEYERQDPVALFAGYPPDVVEHLSYFNVGANPALNSKMNPLRMIKDLAGPDDFVVFKLDIDTITVELQFISQILEDSSISGLIDELYFEHHVHRSPMEHHGWVRASTNAGMDKEPSHINSTKYTVRKDNDITASYEIFHALRERGIRAHSWV